MLKAWFLGACKRPAVLDPQEPQARKAIRGRRGRGFERDFTVVSVLDAEKQRDGLDRFNRVDYPVLIDGLKRSTTAIT